MTLRNFGKNVRFEPAELVRPSDKNAVVVCLERNRGRKIRACGRLHSWSEAAVSHDVVLDLRNLNKVRLEVHADGSASADIEAGCTIDSVLDYLRAHGGYTLPTCGIVGRQATAGAIATATHGSGRPSLSHYVTSVNVAAYDPESGRARIYQWRDGDELRAARCGLGCTGIVLSIGIAVQPDYLVEEITQWFDSIGDVLERERDYPLQQFYLIPWSWKWYAQHRRALTRESGSTRSATAPLHRLFKLLGVDIALHGVVRLLSRLGWRVAIRWFYRRAFPLVARPGMRVIDDSRHILMTRHDIYTHVEMELFVVEQHVRHAATYVEWVLRCCGGEVLPMPKPLTDRDFGCDIATEIAALRGSYVHDYLITFRRVLADDSLISMTSGDNSVPWYAISFITYRGDLAPFLRMARFMAATMASAFRARPHWGKVCPLRADDIASLYPALSQFREHCARYDQEQTFVNDFARQTLGFH
jgi:FAD binding domain/D-arabinono-1,4-lactone oxidase